MCEHEKQIICGTEICGICYEKDLLATKDRAKKIPELEYRYNQDKHIMMMMKPKK